MFNCTKPVDVKPLIRVYQIIFILECNDNNDSKKYQHHVQLSVGLDALCIYNKSIRLVFLGRINLFIDFAKLHKSTQG